MNSNKEQPQGSGEPVAWEVRHWNTNGPAWGVGAWSEWERVQPRNVHTDTVETHLADLRAYIARGLKYELRALYTAPPSAQQATCREDGRCQYAIDHGAEGMGHCPPGKCAMPPSAQQATGSGQVLTDILRRIEIYAKGIHERLAAPEPSTGALTDAAARALWISRCVSEALAAATQAQPEVPAGWKLVPVECTPVMEMAAWNRAAIKSPHSFSTAWGAMLNAAPMYAGSAPTTGKREPLDLIADEVTAFESYLISQHIDGEPPTLEAYSEMFRRINHALRGITGEQR